MTKKLSWKLKQLPNATEVADLVKTKVITAEEAKQILFTESDDKEATSDELKRQIEFLEGLVKELSKNLQTKTHVYKYVNDWSTYTWVVYGSGTAAPSKPLSTLDYAQGLLKS